MATCISCGAKAEAGKTLALSGDYWPACAPCAKNSGLVTARIQARYVK